ncbi:hypothetical protein Micbo1qcDRAFT_1639 [Microdochium bolleyi]|uniref:Uncharacterized protein n=1 Tax=Microdochium bolleyi TaxID=196109 RepID=A0A136JHE3_9PEZI|nr:hypothetical protein Micbo1qcDRAFT_1639 [Microdochium bolleyi]
MVEVEYSLVECGVRACLPRQDVFQDGCLPNLDRPEVALKKHVVTRSPRAADNERSSLSNAHWRNEIGVRRYLAASFTADHPVQDFSHYFIVTFTSPPSHDCAQQSGRHDDRGPSPGVARLKTAALLQNPGQAREDDEKVVRVAWRQCDTRDTVGSDHAQAQRTAPGG